MLIGVDYPDFHFSLKDIRGKPGEPIARLTPLEWTCIGKYLQQTNKTNKPTKLQQAGIKINTPGLILAQQVVSLERLVIISRNFGM